MCEFAIIYLYVMGFLFATIVINAQTGFRTLPFWQRPIVFAAWPLVIPFALINELGRRLARLTHTRRI
mgnify:FL=1